MPNISNKRDLQQYPLFHFNFNKELGWLASSLEPIVASETVQREISYIDTVYIIKMQKVYINIQFCATCVR